MAVAQEWKCSVTGIPFEVGDGSNHASPWAISLDRLDNAGGYVKENIRLVVWAYNLIKSDWTEAEAIEIIRKLASALPKSGTG